MMREKQPGRFEKALKRGRYLFHIHTDWTDGRSSLAEYCEVAKRVGFETIVLAEHVRKKCSYDFNAFLQHARQQDSRHEIEIIVGVEAKILPDGTLDIPDSLYSRIEILAIAEHSFEGDAHALARALCQAFKKYSKRELACVWAHPGLKLLCQHNDELLFQKVVHVALNNGIYIERNLRHDLPPSWILNEIPPHSTVLGLDAHSVEEVERFAVKVLSEEEVLANDAAR